MGRTWSAKGVIVFAPDSIGALSVVSAEGGEPRELTRLDPAAGETGHRHPRFLPDGEHFLFIARGTAGTLLRVGALDGTPPTRLFATSANAEYASGRLLFLRETTLMAQPFDATKLTLSGEPEPLAEHVRVNVGASLAVFSSSQEGTLAYQTRGADERQARLVWRDLSGLERGALGEPGPYFHPRISPDGRQVAVAMLDTAVGTTDLWICDVARGLRHRFASDPAMDTGPVWSPDGQTIAFYSRRGGEGAVWAAPATEITQPRRLWGNSENSTAWSPDGRQILVNSPATVAQEVLTIDSAGGEPRWEIYVTTFGGPGRRWQVSAGGGTEPVWRRDGRGLFYRDDARLHAAEVSGSASEFVVGAIRPLFALPSIFPGGRQWDVSRDGQRILVTEPLAQAAPSAIILTVGWDANLQKP